MNALAQVIPLRPAAFPDRVRAIFRDVLPAAWPGYAARAGQLAMADAVSACLDAGGALMADAPCGTGKSLAYLIPAILRARATGRPAIVATATIALQEQLVAKDLPALAEGRRVILCERVPEYAEIARRRCEAAAQGTDWRAPAEQLSLLTGAR